MLIVVAPGVRVPLVHVAAGNPARVLTALTADLSSVMCAALIGVAFVGFSAKLVIVGSVAKGDGRTQREVTKRRNSPGLNPTLDVIQKVAEALEVSHAQIIGDNTGLMKTSRKTGPTSKVQKVFEVVSSLPRRQQEKIIHVVSALVSQYEQSRQ